MVYAPSAAVRWGNDGLKMLKNFISGGTAPKNLLKPSGAAVA
ncbi:hypothetical protein RA11412_0228 [Rothia aeria]|uniref:Uncharacterized protein n=1 Tax=Rothia aeria TaxID=172042 RepID=A0A2Z5QVU8_9MICC|nr:hypothetical protein RA11412_0228 [Rothia aeria]